jgi:nucleoside-diphosphate-sugar epimerase
MPPEYILITGASGFIGSVLIKKIALEQSLTAIAIVRGMQDYNEMIDLQKKGVLFVFGSYYDKQLVRNVFKRYPIKYVVHIAGLSGVGNGNRKDFISLNVHATETLLEVAFISKVKKFIYCSSVGVFGTIPKEVPATVKTESNADNDYHYSKIIAEKRVEEYRKRGLDAYIIRPTITYGPESKDNAFPSILVKLIKRRLLLLSTKDIQIHLLDVSHLADFFIKVVGTKQQSQKTFIVADNKPVSFRELVDSIHSSYYSRKYPFFLKLPKFIFSISIIFFRLLRSEKWVTRLSLISMSWYYDINEAKQKLHYIPSDTKEVFIRTMCK